MGRYCLRALLAFLMLSAIGVAGDAQAQSQYTIQKGDTLLALSKRFKVTVDDIVRANAVLDPNKIYPGKVITLPANITPPAGYKVEGALLPKKAQDDPMGEDDRPRPTVTQASPQGILLLKGLTWRPVQEAWDVILSDCSEDVCTGSIIIENIGKTPVQGLAIGKSFWYYRTKMKHNCGSLLPGDVCEVKVTYERGFTGGSPGMVMIEAGDARLRPTREDVFFTEEVFWLCPAADMPRCQPKS